MIEVTLQQFGRTFIVTDKDVVYCHRCGAELAEHEDFGAEICDNCQAEVDGAEPEYVSFGGYTFTDSEYEEA